MGWRERDYARFTDAERRSYLGARARGRAATGSGGIRLARGAGAAVVASAALFLVGHVPRGHPLVPALGFRLPLPTHKGASHLGLPTESALGSVLTIHGHLDGYDGRFVTLEGRWNDPTWIALGQAQLAGSGFSIPVSLTQGGLLTLRLRYPNGAVATGETTVH
jgi:hypothetical protein